MNIVKNSNEISTLINLQNDTYVKSRHGCDGNTHHVDPMHMHMHMFKFIDMFTSVWCSLMGLH